MSDHERGSGEDRKSTPESEPKVPVSVDDGSARAGSEAAGAPSEPALAAQSALPAQAEAALPADAGGAQAATEASASAPAQPTEAVAVGAYAPNAGAAAPPVESAVGPPASEAAPTVVVPEHPVRQIVTRAVWMTGALLWAYTVLGEFVYHADGFPEAVAIVALLSALAIPWFRSVRVLPRDKRWRLVTVGSGIAAIVSWLAVVTLVSLLLGNTRRSEYEATTLLVWVVGVVLYFVGRRVTRLPAIPRSAGRTVGGILLWIVVGLATFVAGAKVVDQL